MTAYNDDDSGYMKIQSTKPQTIGYALDDSPAGLAAWIVEKFRTWTDCDGDVERRFTKDQLLDNLMLYWLTATAHSSGAALLRDRQGLAQRGSRPHGGSRLPSGSRASRRRSCARRARWVEAQYTLRHLAEMPRGGHFAALEGPDLLVPDVLEFFRDRDRCSASGHAEARMEGFDVPRIEGGRVMDEFAGQVAVVTGAASGIGHGPGPRRGPGGHARRRRRRRAAALESHRASCATAAPRCSRSRPTCRRRPGGGARRRCVRALRGRPPPVQQRGGVPGRCRLAAHRPTGTG